MMLLVFVLFCLSFSAASSCMVTYREAAQISVECNINNCNLNYKDAASVMTECNFDIKCGLDKIKNRTLFDKKVLEIMMHHVKKAARPGWRVEDAEREYYAMRRNSQLLGLMSANTYVYAQDITATQIGKSIG